MPDVTVQTPRGPLKVPDWADKMASVTSVTTEGETPTTQPAPFKLDDLQKDPGFLALSPEAKMLAVGKRDPGFKKLSPDAQKLVIAKHFGSERLRDMPAQDPLAKTRVEEAEEIARAVGKTALRVGAAIVGGRLGGRPGAALAAGVTSYALGDKPAESLVEAGTAGLFPGTGKTAVGSVAKSGAFAAVSSGAASIARGEWPSGGNMAFNGVIGGVLGYGGFKLDQHLSELMPKDVAKGAANAIEHGEMPAGLSAEEATDIRKLRIQIRDKRGQFLPRKGADEAVGAFKGGTLIRGTVKTGKDYVLEDIRELEKDDIFPPYKPGPPPENARPANEWTIKTAKYNRPMWLMDHIQEQTGIPTYDDVYRSMRTALHGGNQEEIAEVKKRIQKDYLGVEINGKYIPAKNATPPEVQKIIKDFITSYDRRDSNAMVSLMVKSVFKRVPLIGRELSDESAERITNNIMTLPSVQLLAGSVGTPVRMFSHTFQTGFMKLGKYIIPGFTKGLTAEGIRDATRAGAIAPADLHIPEELLSSRNGWYEKAVNMGFSGIKKAQEWSRSIIFSGAKTMGSSALKKAGWGNWEKFMSEAGLDIGIPKAEVGLAKFLYQGKREHELLDHIGKIHAEAYIPGHSLTLDQPMIRRESGLHMAATQLSNWPSFYATTLKENFFGDGPTKKKVVMGARWALANTVLFATAAEVYGKFYKESPAKAAWHAAEMTFAAPLFFAGGAYLEDAANFQRGGKEVEKGAVESVLVDAESGMKHVWSGAKKAVKATPIPFVKHPWVDIYDLFGGKD